MDSLQSELIPAANGETERLLVLLHGLADSMNGLRWVPRALNLPWLNCLLVNAPDPYYGGFSWYDFAGNEADGVRRSRDLLLELLNEQEAKGFAFENTILGGFSQGCLMSLEVGLRLPRPLAGIVGISGYVCDPDRLLREMPPQGRKQRVLITHGTADPILPLGFVKDQVSKLQAGGVTIEWHELEKAHVIAGEAELAIIRDFVTATPWKSPAPKRAG